MDRVTSRQVAADAKGATMSNVGKNAVASLVVTVLFMVLWPSSEPVVVFLGAYAGGATMDLVRAERRNP